MSGAEREHEDHALLDACLGPHGFRALRGPTGNHGQNRARRRCSLRGGEVSGAARLRYWRGLRGARRAAAGPAAGALP